MRDLLLDRTDLEGTETLLLVEDEPHHPDKHVVAERCPTRLAHSGFVGEGARPSAFASHRPLHAPAARRADGIGWALRRRCALLPVVLRPELRGRCIRLLVRLLARVRFPVVVGSGRLPVGCGVEWCCDRDGWRHRRSWWRLGSVAARQEGQRRGCNPRDRDSVTEEAPPVHCSSGRAPHGSPTHGGMERRTDARVKGSCRLAHRRDRAFLCSGFAIRMRLVDGPRPEPVHRRGHQAIQVARASCRTVRVFRRRRLDHPRCGLHRKRIGCDVDPRELDGFAAVLRTRLASS